VGRRHRYVKGDKLAGYSLEVLGKIGSGGMGAVYEVTDTELGVARAVKVLDVDATGIGGKDPMEELRNEARVMARLYQRCKRNIVQVLFVGQTKDDQRSLFIVMEKLVGYSLREVIKERGALGWTIAKQIVQEIGEALAVAHEERIVHRDIKPANIFCQAPPDERDLNFVLLDFGIASLIDKSTQRFRGTFKGAAPEQMRSPAVLTAQTDIYALGLVFFEALTGQHPFEGCKNDGEFVRAHFEKTPPLVSTLAPGAPPELDALIASMLAKDPAKRPESARALIERVNQIRWDDQRDLRSPADIDTTVEELGTAVANKMEEVAPDVPLPFAPTDRISPLKEDPFAPPPVKPEAPEAAGGSTKRSKAPDARIVAVDRAAPVVEVSIPPDALPSGQGIRSAPTRTSPNRQRLPDTTEPMYDAPPLPAEAIRARAAAPKQTERMSTVAGVHTSSTQNGVSASIVGPWWRARSRTPAIVVGAVVFFGVVIGIAAIVKHVGTTAAAIAPTSLVTVSSAATTPSAMPPTLVALPTAIATTTNAQTATPPATPPVVAPAVAAAPSTPKPTPHSDGVAVVSHAAPPRTPPKSSASGAAADVGADMFRPNRLPGSGL
jgi:serine/threonine-protein kinase